MTLKERKILIEQNVKYGLQRSVGENVNIGVAYNLDESVLLVSLTEQHFNQESQALEGVVNYGIRYNENNDQLSIYAFSRRYQYDNLGLINVVVDPVYVDEGFISTIKELIRFGMSDQFDASVFDPQPVEEAQPIEAEIVEE
jgi:hypothetical protein